MNVDATAACCAPIARTGLGEADAERAASLFRVLGDPARVRIVNLLATSGEVCVCELTPELGLAQPTVSFHLKKLTAAGLVAREQRGRWAYYSLRPAVLADLAAALDPEGAVRV